MERIDLRKENLDKAYSALNDAITIFNTAQNNPNFNKQHILAFQDSVIKRFEFCYELTWKYLKDLLQNKYGILVNAPKKVFLACQAQNLLSDKELATLLNIADSRNSTSHEYNELAAKNINQEIIRNYYPSMQAIINRLAT